MSINPETPRRKILRQLLEQYERSGSFGQPRPWRRDILLHLDAKRFPDAFAPNGREAMEALYAACETLKREGAIRLVYDRGFASGIPREVRLGPEELPVAYRLGSAEGFVPLSDTIDAFSSRLKTIRRGTLPDWMDRFLVQVENSARQADFSPLGMRRERFKRERQETEDALLAAAALSEGIQGWERTVSERLFGFSKRLATIRSRVIDLLLHSDPRWEGIPREEAGGLLEAYGLRGRPGVIHCAGACEMMIQGRRYRLEDFVPSAHLPEAWLDSWVDGIVKSSIEQITTIENEYPFFSYVEERDGPVGLGEKREVAIYTGGFPSPALVESLISLAARKESIFFRHWGDADVGGLRIWWLLRSRLGRPVSLFRTTPDWFDAAARQGGISLVDTERKALIRLRTYLSSSDWADLSDAIKLIDSLLRLGVKVEQERYIR